MLTGWFSAFAAGGRRKELYVHRTIHGKWKLHSVPVGSEFQLARGVQQKRPSSGREPVDEGAEEEGSHEVLPVCEKRVEEADAQRDGRRTAAPRDPGRLRRRPRRQRCGRPDDAQKQKEPIETEAKTQIESRD